MVKLIILTSTEHLKSSKRPWQVLTNRLSWKSHVLKNLEYDGFRVNKLYLHIYLQNCILTYSTLCKISKHGHFRIFVFCDFEAQHWSLSDLFLLFKNQDRFRYFLPLKLSIQGSWLMIENKTLTIWRANLAMALQKFQVYADKPALLSCNQTMKLYDLTVDLGHWKVTE